MWSSITKLTFNHLALAASWSLFPVVFLASGRLNLVLHLWNGHRHPGSESILILPDLSLAACFWLSWMPILDVWKKRKWTPRPQPKPDVLQEKWNQTSDICSIPSCQKWSSRTLWAEFQISHEKWNVSKTSEHYAGNILASLQKYSQFNHWRSVISAIFGKTITHSTGLAETRDLHLKISNRQIDQTVTKGGAVTREFSIGQTAIARNYTGSTKWVPGII